MKLACSHCQAIHEYADKRPAFCSQCGQPYPPPDPDATRTHDLDATGPDLSNRAGGNPIPRVIGGYRLLRLLGEGGMGKVYETEELATCRRVALKLIAPQNVASAAAVTRFRREGQLAATITHPRCVFLLRADEEAGQPYLVMELMPGTTLKDLVAEKGPLSAAEAVARIFDVMDGLGALHEVGIIHRDVKPANCFLEAGGHVKIGDFGLARTLLSSDDSLTGTGVFVGTPLFASPEQLKGHRVDVRTDVYSVATTLYFLLTGTAPFQGSDGAGVVARIASEDPPPLRSRRPDLPPALERVVLRGLARDPEKRYQNLDDFRVALSTFLPGKRLTFGAMGLRFFAFVVDAAIILAFCSAVVLTLTFLVGLVPFWLGTIIACATICIYAGVLEGLLGWTPGKWLLGLRVYAADAERPPGVARATARVVAGILLLNLLNGDVVALLPLPSNVKHFFAARFTVATIYYDLPQLHQQVPLVVGFFLVATHVGILPLLCTMRQRNGYRGLHEFISGTRVVRLPSPPRRERIRLKPSQPPNPFIEEPALNGPRRLGPYDVHEVLSGADGSDLLLGEDAALGRRVLLVRRPKSEEGLSPARKAVDRMTRPRWLSSGTADGQRWHAFVAPNEGWSLPNLLQVCPPLPWRETRLLLAQLAEELAAAQADGTLPEQLTVEQIWVQPDGKLLLLDWPVHAPLAAAPSLEPPAMAIPPERPVSLSLTSSGEPATETTCLALLRQVAVLALEGKRRPAFAPPSPIQARVPLHAAAMLARLLRVDNPYKQLEEFQSDLETTKEKPTEVNWMRLAVYVMVETVLVYTGIMYLPMLFLLTKEHDESANGSEGCAMFFAFMYLLYGLFFSLLVCPPLTVLIAVLMRGGVSFYVTDLALVTWNGKPARRWRCALRALLTWVQLVIVAGLPAVGTFMLVAIPYPIYQSWAAILLYFHLLAYALIGEMLVAWFPGRSLADRLCGTYLAPK